MKDNAYDSIRKEKFRVPSKIALTEDLMRSHPVVINWWCRQSGKTLTAVKIVRDRALDHPGSSILVVTPNRSTAAYYIEMFSRSIDREHHESKGEFKLKLKNGSVITASSSASFDPKSIADNDNDNGSYDIVIVDEFEFMPRNHLSSILKEIAKLLRPGWITRLLRSLKSWRSKTSFLFVSSMKDGMSLQMIQDTLPHTIMSKLNWEATNANRDELVKAKGLSAFELEYNSYK